MTMRPTRWWWAVVVQVVVVGLALFGAWSRRGDRGRCAFDGAAIEPVYRVRVEGPDGQTHPFCCIRCAELWLEAHPGPTGHVVVTDESSGKDVDAAVAWFVRSSIVTQPTTGNRIHAFRHRVDAEHHADIAGGRVLSDIDRPFKNR